MAPIYDSHEYYKKMLDMQEKLRKSEEERIRLEERFNLLVQESRIRRDECLNRLRLRYIEFLEEQRERDERNHNLLGVLNKVDNSLTLMMAKTDRLNILRKQYEAYLVTAYGNRRSAGSDSGVASHNEDGSRRIREDYSSSLQEAKTFSYRVPEPRHYAPISARYQESGTNYSTSSEAYRNGPSPLNSVDNRRKSNSSFTRNVQVAEKSGGYSSGWAPYNGLSPTALASSLEKDTRGHGRDSLFSFQDDPRVRQIQTPRNMYNPSTVDADKGNAARIEERASFGSLGPVSDVALQSRDLTVQNLRHYDLQPRIPFRGDSASINYKSRLSTPTPRWSTPGPKYSIHPPKYSPNLDSLKESPSLTTCEVNEMQKRVEPSARIPETEPSYALSRVEEQKRPERVVKNDLDRYIDRIRNLHSEQDLQSLEEADHEENTSGDILNVTLSEDELDVEGKARDKLSEEVAGVLALASDLASGVIHPDESRSFHEVDEDSRTRRGLPGSSGAVFENEHAMDGIGKSIPTSGQDMNAGTRICLSDEEISRSIKNRLLLGTESEVEPQVFSIVEELQPWSLKFVERQVREVHLDPEGKQNDVLEEELEHDSGTRDLEYIEEEPDAAEDQVVSGGTKSEQVRDTVEEVSMEERDKSEIDDLDTRNSQDQRDEYRNNGEVAKTDGDDQSSVLVTEQQQPREISDGSKVYEEESSCQEDQFSYDPSATSEKYEYNEQVGDYQQQYSEQYSDQHYQDYSVTEDSGNRYEQEPRQEYTYEDEYGQSQQYQQDEQQYQQQSDQQYQQDGQQYQQQSDQQYQQDDQQYQQQSDQQYQIDDQYQANGQENQQEYDETDQRYQQDQQQYDQNPDQYVVEPAQHQEYKDKEYYDSDQGNPPENELPSQDNNYSYDDTGRREETGDDSKENNFKSEEDARIMKTQENPDKEPKKKDVIRSILDSDTDSTIERNVSNTESDFDFN